MPTTQFLGYLSGVLIIASFAPYVRDIFWGKTKPQRASWLIWALLGTIAFFSQWAKGAGDSLWLPGVQALGDLSIFVLALWYGVGGMSRGDIFALTGAGVGLILWYLTNEPALALFISILIDGAGAVLTVIKAYHSPGSETVSSWVLTWLGGASGALAVGELNFVLLAFPIYIVLACSAILGAIFIGRSREVV
ncbi:MAG TPA: hypothetical protein VJL32_01905 [Candidatus Paceibacterota bacterium]